MWQVATSFLVPPFLVRSNSEEDQLSLTVQGWRECTAVELEMRMAYSKPCMLEYTEQAATRIQVSH